MRGLENVVLLIVVLATALCHVSVLFVTQCYVLLIVVLNVMLVWCYVY